MIVMQNPIRKKNTKHYGVQFLAFNYQLNFLRHIDSVPCTFDNDDFLPNTFTDFQYNMFKI